MLPAYLLVHQGSEWYNHPEMGKFTRKKKSERVREILDAGIEVFGRKGFRDTTMEDIISETSLSKGGFYHYFKSTDEIMLAIMESETGVAQSLILQEIEGVPVDGLIDAVVSAMMARIFRENPSKKLFVMFFLEMIYKPEFLELYLELERRSFGSENPDTPAAKAFDLIVSDERTVFLSRLNTVMILFYHIFPGKALFRKYSFYIEQLFKKLLTDIVEDGMSRT